MALEYPVTFLCENELLAGIIHKPVNQCKRGVVIVVAGGPQYRVGAHRQFILLARKLSLNGMSTMRFDLRGMGDSSGNYVGFEESRPDIKSAIDTFINNEPDIKEIILLGECESASGILFYAYNDTRVKGIVLINPWVRTNGGQAQAYLKHYYINRLLEKSFWGKIFSGQFNPIQALQSFIQIAISAQKWKRATSNSTIIAARETREFDSLPLPVKTAVGLKNFTNKCLILISGKDIIAREFDEVITNTQEWKGVIEKDNIERFDLKDADHTFSRKIWREQASDKIISWLNNL